MFRLKKGLQNLVEDLPGVEEDKANHFIYGLLIYFIITLFFGDLIGMIICFLSAILKEVYDHYSPNHQFDWWDFIWTVMGGLIGLLIHLS